MIPSDLLPALHQESFVHLLREELMTAETSFETSDHELLVAEAKQESLAGDVARLKQEILDRETLRKNQEHDLFAKRRTQQKLKRITEVLFDFQGLFSGTLFAHGQQGAKFFTLDLKAFASAQGYGEMMVEDGVRSSADGLFLVITGKKFWYLRGGDRALYFHPYALSDSDFSSDSSAL